MILTFRPIKDRPAGWADVRAGRPSSPFIASYRDTLDLLDRELGQLGATDAFMQVDAQPGQIRNDGQLYANAVVHHPGVILTIDTPAHGVLVYDTDRYEARPGQVAWQQNLRAIALGLEALRKVDRYGIADRGQQYTGYRELGSGIAMGSGQLNPMDAADELGVLAGWRATPAPDEFRVAYKDAARNCHPDTGGTTADFQRLQVVAAALGLTK